MSRCIADESFKDTGFFYTWSLIRGKYKTRVLYSLMEFGVVRYGEMKRYIDPVSHKMLSSTLKELECDGLIRREEYDQLPLKDEYSLTPRGRSLIPLLDLMCQWGDDHRSDDHLVDDRLVERSRKDFRSFF